MQSVWVVDVDDWVESSLVTQLNSQGFDVRKRAMVEAAKWCGDAAADEPPPDIIIFDQLASSAHDLQLCLQLKGREHPPHLIVVARDGSPLDRQQLYSKGIDTILSFGTEIDDVSAVLHKIKMEREQRRDLQQQLVLARSAAFVAMSTSSRVGQIVRFMQASMDAQSVQSLSSILFDLLGASMSLYGALHFDLGGSPEYFSDRSVLDSHEMQLLAELQPEKRVVERDNILIVRDEHCSMLIRNFPDDAELRGQLRDDLCILIEAIESRCKGLILERQSERQRRVLQTSLRVLGKILEDADTFNLEFTRMSEKIIGDMMFEMNAEFSTLTLDEVEEQRLLVVLDKSSSQLGGLFDEKRQRDGIIQEIMQRLLATLAV